MFSRFQSCTSELSELEPFHSEGRFVLHRHRDKYGDHLDLRIEQDGYLLGWRLEAQELGEVMWGTEKLPHHPAWLEEKNGVEVVLTGKYRWHSHDENSGYLILYDDQNTTPVRTYRIDRWRGLPLSIQQKIARCVQQHGIRWGQLAGLIEDGLTARKQAIHRLRGLVQFLDGESLDDSHWIQLLEQASLHEIHRYLHQWSVRAEMQQPPPRLTKPDPNTMPITTQNHTETPSRRWQQLVRLLIGKHNGN